jgi:secreted protein with Ig-like and vWFA domain
VDEPLAAQAMQRIADHIDACSHNYGVLNDTFVQVRESIKNTNKLLITFMTGVAACVITFAAYQYTQSQALAAQLAESRSATASAIQQIPVKTAQAVGAIEVPTNNPKTGN